MEGVQAALTAPAVAVLVLVAGCATPPGLPHALGPPPAAPAPGAPAAGALRVHVVDVGQGDGVVWELPGGGFVVYDCGPPAPSAGANPVVALLRSLGLAPGGVVHALVASHGHRDHIGGCEEVLAEHRILHLYEAWYDGADAPASYARFREELRAEGGTLHVLRETPAVDGEAVFRAGDLVDLPPEAAAAGVRAELLWPPSFQGQGWDDIEASSLVVRLSLGSVDFCLQGDIDQADEAALAGRFGGRDCEVYLVGHHGSRYASSAGWLAAMDPEVALASFGPNGHGHPSAEALCRVQQAGASVHATHRAGTVRVATDGTRFEVHPPAPETKDYCAAGASYWAP